MDTYVTANGIRIHLEEAGQGHPLLLLHGAMGTAHDNFADAILALASHFRVLAPEASVKGLPGISVLPM